MVSIEREAGNIFAKVHCPSHIDAKWVDDDFVALESNVKCGHVAFVIYFVENYYHKPKFEHQSKYLSQVQTTIAPVVLMLQVEDTTNISSEEKAELIALFRKLNLPRVISETHYINSGDMVHNAFVPKALDDHITPYILRVMQDVRWIHVRSD